MADACARTTGTLGVCLTSTGTAAGNAAGAMVEALTAGTPLLHITGQIEVPYLDRDLAYIHEAPDQLTMLSAVSKAAWRVRSAETALATFKQAVQAALTAPTGPVSVEVPIDIQSALIDMPADLEPLPVVAVQPDAARASTRWPTSWPAHAVRCCGWVAVRAARAHAVRRLMDARHRRGHHRRRAAASCPRRIRCRSARTTCRRAVEAFYQTCDAMLVVGSRLRGNETLKYQLKLPAAAVPHRRRSGRRRPLLQQRSLSSAAMPR